MLGKAIKTVLREMSTNTYFRHYVIHYIAKTLKVYDMGYRLYTWCFFMHESLKRDKKENDEKKKSKITRKLIFGMLLCIYRYHSWNIVGNDVYRSWIALVSSVFPLLTTFFSNFSEKSKDILEWKIFELEIWFSVTRFNNMQFKSSTHKKL